MMMISLLFFFFSVDVWNFVPKLRCFAVHFAAAKLAGVSSFFTEALELELLQCVAYDTRSSSQSKTSAAGIVACVLGLAVLLLFSRWTTGLLATVVKLLLLTPVHITLLLLLLLLLPSPRPSSSSSFWSISSPWCGNPPESRRSHLFFFSLSCKCDLIPLNGSCLSLSSAKNNLLSELPSFSVTTASLLDIKESLPETPSTPTQQYFLLLLFFVSAFLLCQTVEDSMSNEWYLKLMIH